MGQGLLRILIPVIVLLLLISFVVVKKTQQNKPAGFLQPQNEIKKDNTPPVIKNLGVEFAPYDTATGRAGDFIFVDQGEWPTVFAPFGWILAKGTENEHINPALEYDTDPNAVVKIAADGVVIRMVYQDDSRDWDIFTSPNTSSPWVVAYDHVIDPVVKEGGKVVAGQKLGKVGTWSNNLGRVELTVGKREENLFYSYCPLKYFDPSLKAEYEQKVSRLMADWEQWIKNPNIFDEEKFFMPGCVYEAIVEEENSGKPARPVQPE